MFDVCENVVLVISIVGTRLWMLTSSLKKGTKAQEVVCVR